MLQTLGLLPVNRAERLICFLVKHRKRRKCLQFFAWTWFWYAFWHLSVKSIIACCLCVGMISTQYNTAYKGIIVHFPRHINEHTLWPSCFIGQTPQHVSCIKVKGRIWHLANSERLCQQKGVHQCHETVQSSVLNPTCAQYNTGMASLACICFTSNYHDFNDDIAILTVKRAVTETVCISSDSGILLDGWKAWVLSYFGIQCNGLSTSEGCFCLLVRFRSHGDLISTLWSILDPITRSVSRDLKRILKIIPGRRNWLEEWASGKPSWQQSYATTCFSSIISTMKYLKTRRHATLEKKTLQWSTVSSGSHSPLE